MPVSRAVRSGGPMLMGSSGLAADEAAADEAAAAASALTAIEEPDGDTGKEIGQLDGADDDEAAPAPAKRAGSLVQYLYSNPLVHM